MDWDIASWTDEDEAAEPEVAAESGGEADEIYTLHQNPIYIATKAIYLSLLRSWQKLAGDSDRVPPRLAVDLLSSLHRGEMIAVEAVHALDFGDYAMAVSLFKQALSELNRSLALLQGDAARGRLAVAAWRETALPCCFDLREIWLRVIAECRDELRRPLDSDEE
jgi:hypothetical protein